MLGRDKKAIRRNRRLRIPETPPRVACISVGSGAYALGAMRAGASVVGAMDFDDVACQCFSANFPAIPLVHPGDIRGLPHPDVVLICNENEEWARIATLRLSPRVVCFERKTKDKWLNGYVCYGEEMDALEFGLPQKRKRKFVVAFRLDAKPKFISFPFPDPPGATSLAGSILEEGREDLLVPREWGERMARRDEKKRESGFRYKLRVVDENGVFPSISPLHHGLRTSMVVKDSVGKRLISIGEAKGAMGIPRGFSMPADRKEALRILASDACVPVVRAIMEEIKVWLY